VPDTGGRLGAGHLDTSGGDGLRAPPTP